MGEGSLLGLFRCPGRDNKTTRRVSRPIPGYTHFIRLPRFARSLRMILLSVDERRASTVVRRPHYLFAHPILTPSPSRRFAQGPSLSPLGRGVFISRRARPLSPRGEGGTRPEHRE